MARAPSALSLTIADVIGKSEARALALVRLGRSCSVPVEPIAVSDNATLFAVAAAASRRRSTEVSDFNRNRISGHAYCMTG